MGIGTVIYGFIVSVLVLALIRELVCWYWKINTMVTEQKKQTELLKQILDVLKDTNEKSTPYGVLFPNFYAFLFWGIVL